MAKEHSAKKQKFGLHLQTDWDTVGTAATAFETQFYDAAVTSPDYGISAEQFEFSSAKGLMPELNRSRIDTKGIKQVGFSAYADRLMLAHHLAAAYQSVSEAAATPYLKTVVPANQVVDFNGDEGFVYTLAMGNYDNGSNAGDGQVFKQGILNDLSIEFNNEGEGIAKGAKLNGNWFFTSVDTDQYLSGTWTNTTAPANILGLESADAYVLNLTWDSVNYSDICWHRLMLSLNNNVSGTCRGAGGVITQWRLGEPELTYEIDIPKNDSTYALIGDHAAGKMGSFSFTRNMETPAAGSFSITPVASSCEFSAAPYTYSNGYEVIRLSGRILANATGVFTNLIRFADGTDRGY